VKTAQVTFNGMGGGRILCCYKYVEVVLDYTFLPLISYTHNGDDTP